MKKTLALLLALVLALGGSCACAAENWYEQTAEELAARMALLADNLTYAAFFYDVKQDDVEEQLAEMSALDGMPVQGVRMLRYQPQKAEEAIFAYFMQDRVDDQNAAVADELLSRMNLALPDLLNHLVGGWQWQALSRIMQCTATCEAPADFRECALVMDYGTDVSVLVTFTRTGESTVTAQGSYIRAAALDDETARPFLSLLWEKE